MDDEEKQRWCEHSSMSEFKQLLNEPDLVEEKQLWGWFFRHDTTNTSQIKHIVTGLLRRGATEWLNRFHMVQFWAVVKVEGSLLHLSASGQPFCVAGLRKGACKYRKNCVESTYYVEATEDLLGLTRPVYTDDSEIYPAGINWFPRFGFSYMVFLMSDSPRHCYGVLEILSLSPRRRSDIYFERGLMAFKTPKTALGNLLLMIHRFRGDDCPDDEGDRDGKTLRKQELARAINKIRRVSEKKMVVESYHSLPLPLKMMCTYAMDNRNKGRVKVITLDDEVFGEKCEAYVHLTDTIPFCDLEDIPLHFMVVYIWHLYKKIKKEDKLGRFQFENPFVMSYSLFRKINTGIAWSVLEKRLIGTSPNQIVLLPTLEEFQWILTIIEPYKNIVYVLGSSRYRDVNERWRRSVRIAMNNFNRNLGRHPTEKPTWQDIWINARIEQNQSGYYVMHFMKKIVEGLGTIDSSSLSSLNLGDECSQADIDEVRAEWARCLFNS